MNTETKRTIISVILAILIIALIMFGLSIIDEKKAEQNKSEVGIESLEEATYIMKDIDKFDIGINELI